MDHPWIYVVFAAMDERGRLQQIDRWRATLILYINKSD
jgi:hypothetical protein